MPCIPREEVSGEPELLMTGGKNEQDMTRFKEPSGLVCELAYRACPERLVFRSRAAALTELAAACSEAGSTFSCPNPEIP